MTLNTALLGLTGIFLSRTSGGPKAILLLIVFWILQLLSLACAMIKLWGWSTEQEGTGERWEKYRKKARTVAECPFVSLIAYATFVLGIAFFLLFIALNILS